MKHGYQCKCPGCAIGRILGVIKKPNVNDANCDCGSGKPFNECCGGEHEHHDSCGCGH